MSFYNLDIQQLRIPFRHAFTHASASRAETCAVLVRATNDDGLSGWGEGCPRPYVTGETIETALAFFAEVQARVRDEIRDIEQLRHWVRGHAELIDRNPAAWCAVETALLDLFARERDISLEQALDLPALSRACQYTAILGDMSMPAYEAMLRRYQSYGFDDYKLKITGQLDHDRARLACLGPSYRVRADANNLWQHTRVAADYLRALRIDWRGDLFAIEEPLQTNDYPALVQLADETGLPVILDESFTRPDQLEQLEQLEQLDRLNAKPSPWILNLRVSKLGGLIRALDILHAARNMNHPVVVGAQVGETSILTRCGISLAHAAGDAVIAQEGAFGTLLLERDVCEQSLMFGQGGTIQGESITGDGLGFAVEYN